MAAAAAIPLSCAIPPPCTMVLPIRALRDNDDSALVTDDDLDLNR